MIKKEEADEEPEECDLEEEVNKLKEKFKEVFNDEDKLKPMLGEPYKIKLRDDIPIKPIHVSVPKRTPYAFQGASKKKIDTLVREGVISESIVNSVEAL